MSKIVSNILKKCNTRGVESPLNILVYPFDIPTECKLSETGHNFYRLNLSKETVNNLPENLFVLPLGEIPFCFDYDMIIFRNGSMPQESFQKLVSDLQLPFIVIDNTSSVKEDEFLITNIHNKDEDTFVEQWKQLLKEFKEVYLT
mgnify:FL=1|tara:strand:- start:130 stop:564 length:435 start_codon:yes stop_codon:yes gene_type:complete